MSQFDAINKAIVDYYAWTSRWASGVRRILDRIPQFMLKLNQKAEGRDAPGEVQMEGKIKVVITYKSGKVGHSRYGYSERVETAVRFVASEDLDAVIDQFRARHEITDVKISR